MNQELPNSYPEKIRIYTEYIEKSISDKYCWLYQIANKDETHLFMDMPTKKIIAQTGSKR